MKLLNVQSELVNFMKNSNILSELENIKRNLVSESQKIKTLDSYNGEMFDNFKYKIALDGALYSLDKNIERDTSAIYIFVADHNLQYIPDSFNEVRFGSKAKKKNIKIADNETNTNNRYVYLGKTFTIQQRIKEHLESEDSSPYSLKYNHEKRKNVLQNSTLYIFELKEIFSEYKEIILSTIETILHIECHPLIGSKRV